MVDLVALMASLHIVVVHLVGMASVDTAAVDVVVAALAYYARPGIPGTNSCPID